MKTFRKALYILLVTVVSVVISGCATDPNSQKSVDLTLTACINMVQNALEDKAEKADKGFTTKTVKEGFINASGIHYRVVDINDHLAMRNVVIDVMTSQEFISSYQDMLFKEYGLPEEVTTKPLELLSEDIGKDMLFSDHEETLKLYGAIGYAHLQYEKRKYTRRPQFQK